MSVVGEVPKNFDRSFDIFAHYEEKLVSQFSP